MSVKKHFLDFPIFKAPDFKDSGLPFRGKNRQGILVLLDNGEDKEELVSFLAKVLSAAKLDLEQDILLLPVSGALPLSSILRIYPIQTVLIFGLPPNELGLNWQFPLYTPLTFKEHRFILCDSLQAIHAERQQGGKKMSGALWKCLQILFLS